MQFGMKKQSYSSLRVASCVLGLASLILVSAESAHSGGKSRTPASGGDAGQSAPSDLKTPHPFRPAILKPVGTRVFSLPNGARVDLQADLDVMFATALTEKSRFLPLEAGSEDPSCSTRLEARASITSLELKVAQIGVKFGYSPSGETSVPISNLTGKTAVQIGTVAMDFGIWQCQASRCVEIVATTATHATAGVELGIDIDFTQVTTGTSLLYNSPLGPALRKIMQEGVKKLAASARTPKLSWYATVRDVSDETGMILFDAGTQAGVGENEAFEVYARTPSLSVCDVYKTVARVKTERADARASSAVIEELLDARGVEVGDIVLVRELNSTSAK